MPFECKERSYWSTGSIVLALPRQLYNEVTEKYRGVCSVLISLERLFSSAALGILPLRPRP